MIRIVFAAAVAAALGATLAAAASPTCQDIIDTRQDLMKKSAAAGKAGFAMVKGEAPFDLAKAQEILATFANDAGQMPVLFPDCSKTGEHTSAAPEVWSRPDDFKEATAKFAADVKAAQDSTKDLDTFKMGMQAIGKDCGSCHEKFRIKQS